MKSVELSGKTVAELRSLATKKKVALPAGAKRADIVRALLKTGGVAEASPKRAVTGTKATAARKGTAKAAAGAKAKARTATKSTAKAKDKPKPKAKAKAVKNGARGVTAGSRKTAKKLVPRGAAAATRETLAVQERIEDAKFYTGPSDRQHPFLDALPSEYGSERVALLARDPDTVFCYWEVPKARLDKERARQGKDNHLCVRIYDVTGIQFDGTNATSFFDQEVDDRLGSWYFELRRPAHAFCAEIGLRMRSGRFRAIARSKVLFTPPAGVSDLADDEWSPSEEQLLKIFGAAAEGAGGRSSEQLRQWVRRQRGAALSSPGVSSWGLPGSGKR